MKKTYWPGLLRRWQLLQCHFLTRNITIILPVYRLRTPVRIAPFKSQMMQQHTDLIHSNAIRFLSFVITFAGLLLCWCWISPCMFQQRVVWNNKICTNTTPLASFRRCINTRKRKAFVLFIIPPRGATATTIPEFVPQSWRAPAPIPPCLVPRVVSNAALDPCPARLLQNCPWYRNLGVPALAAVRLKISKREKSPAPGIGARSLTTVEWWMWTNKATIGISHVMVTASHRVIQYYCNKNDSYLSHHSIALEFSTETWCWCCLVLLQYGYRCFYYSCCCCVAYVNANLLRNVLYYRYCTCIIVGVRDWQWINPWKS